MTKKFFREVVSGALAIVVGAAICEGAGSVRSLYRGQAIMNERLARIETKLGIADNQQNSTNTYADNSHTRINFAP